MDFDQIYNTQKIVMGKIENYVNDLEGYLKDLSNVVSDINLNWKSDAGEKYYIVKAIQDIRVTIGKNIRKYRTFTSSARAYLEQMHQFNTYNGSRSNGVCVVSNIKATKSSKTLVIIDTTKIRAVSTKLQSIVKKMDNTMGLINTQINSVDSMVAITIAGGKNVLKGYKNSLSSQNDRIRAIASSINTIANNYEKAESDIKKAIDNIDNIDITVSEMAEEFAEATIDMMLDATSIIGSIENSGIQIDPKNLKESLKNLFDKLDKYAKDYDNIKDLLEAITGDNFNIPVLSFLIENYSKYKDKYDSIEEFVNDVKSGKLFDDLKNPTTVAGILTDACQFFGPEVAFLANAASYATTVWGETLTEFDYSSYTGNPITDSVHFWGAFAENVMEDAYDKGKEIISNTIEKGENLVKDGLNSIYNVAENLADSVLGIDLTEQYGKLGIDIKDTINNFSIDNMAKGAENLYNEGKKAVSNICKTVAGWF